jgi:hypothetical protein
LKFEKKCRDQSDRPHDEDEEALDDVAEIVARVFAGRPHRFLQTPVYSGAGMKKACLSLFEDLFMVQFQIGVIRHC